MDRGSAVHHRADARDAQVVEGVGRAAMALQPGLEGVGVAHLGVAFNQVREHELIGSLARGESLVLLECRGCLPDVAVEPATGIDCRGEWDAVVPVDHLLPDLGDGPLPGVDLAPPQAHDIGRSHGRLVAPDPDRKPAPPVVGHLVGDLLPLLMGDPLVGSAGDGIPVRDELPERVAGSVTLVDGPHVAFPDDLQVHAGSALGRLQPLLELVEGGGRDGLMSQPSIESPHAQGTLAVWSWLHLLGLLLQPHR